MKKQTTRQFLISITLIGSAVGFAELGLSINPSCAQEDGKPSETESAKKSQESSKQTDSPKESETASLTCPKCSGAMESGYVRDYFASNGYDVSVWSPGHPKLNIIPFFNGKTIKVAVYRCTKCGYLESYAK